MAWRILVEWSSPRPRPVDREFYPPAVFRVSVHPRARARAQSSSCQKINVITPRHARNYRIRYKLTDRASSNCVHLSRSRDDHRFVNRSNYTYCNVIFFYYELSLISIPSAYTTNQFKYNFIKRGRRSRLPRCPVYYCVIHYCSRKIVVQCIHLYTRPVQIIFVPKNRRIILSSVLLM